MHRPIKIEDFLEENNGETGKTKNEEYFFHIIESPSKSRRH